MLEAEGNLSIWLDTIKGWLRRYCKFPSLYLEVAVYFHRIMKYDVYQWSFGKWLTMGTLFAVVPSSVMVVRWAILLQRERRSQAFPLQVTTDVYVI
jgi:hypothetical protein